MEGLFAFTLILAAFSLSLAVDPLCEGVPPGAIVLFPYPNDCTKYYECNAGEKIERNCPYGLWFNNALQNCDHPDHSGCIPPSSTPPTTVTTPHPMCPPGIVDYYPYPYDCQQYYECYYGSLEIRTCPSSLWFDAVLKRCVYPEDSTCIPSTSTVQPTWTTPTAACWGVLPGITELKPYPGDCTKFIECFGAERTDMSCPRPLYFNAAKQLCDWPSESGCDDTTASPPTGSTEYPTTLTTPSGNTDDPRCSDGRTTYWPHPDCTKFVECYLGHSYTMECPSGLFFDSALEKCVDPSESDCGRSTTIAPSTSTKDHDWTPDPDCPWPSTERYLYPYPGDCTKFYECAEGEKVIASCPADLYFNPDLLVCDYPYHAGCQWA